MADVIVCLVIIAASVFFFVLTFSFPTLIGFERLGPEFWPRLNLAVMVIMAVVIMIRSIQMQKREISSEVEPKGKEEEKKHIADVLICWAFLIAFVLLMVYIGFLLSAFLAMAVLIFYLGEKKMLSALLTAFCLVLFIYVSFGKLLFVPMPRGVWLFRELSYYLY